MALKGIEEAVENGKLLKLWEDDSVVSVGKDIVVSVPSPVAPPPLSTSSFYLPLSVNATFVKTRVRGVVFWDALVHAFHSVF